MSKSHSKRQLRERILEFGAKSYKYFIFGVLILLHIALVPGLYIAMQVGRPRFFGLAMYVVLAVALFDILFVLTKTRPYVVSNTKTGVFPYLLDWRATAGALFISIAVLAISGRGLVLYLSFTVVFSLLLFRVLTSKNRIKNLVTNLALITGAASTLIISQVFTVAYYAPTTDTIKHTAVVTNIVETGTLAELASTHFEGFLVFHVLSSIGVQLTGVNVRPLTALLMLVIFQVALISVVLTVRRWSISTTVALTVGVLFAFNNHFLTWASKAHYQSLSFVFLAILILILTIQLYDQRVIVVGMFVLVAWIATHHLSFAMALSLATVPFGIGAILYRIQPQFRRAAMQYLIIITTFLVYWSISTNQIVKPLTWIFVHSPAASTDLPSTQIFISIYESASALISASIPIFLSYFQLAFWLAICLIGILYLFSDKSNTLSNRKKLLLLSAFTVSAVFYFPNPLWVPLRGVGTLARWGIMTLPFLIFIPAYGIYQLSEYTNRNSASALVAALLVMLLVFTTIGAGMTSPSLANIMGYDRQNQKYLSEQDLQAVSFVQAQSTSNQAVYGTSSTTVYAFYQKWAHNPDLSGNQYSRVNVTGITGDVIINPGLTIFQKSAFKENSVKVRAEVSSGIYENGDGISATVSNDKISWNPMKFDMVYTNGDTVVQHQKQN